MSEAPPPAGFARLILVVMGVSGSGKTTVAEALDARLGWPFQEGDALHPPANVAKMRAGQALDDADRAPWLAAIATWIDARRAAGEPGIVTCSALKRAYRQVLVGDRPDVRLVYLKVARAELERRLAARHHEYMPASLLDSQLATLEEPDDNEAPIVVDVTGSVDDTVAKILQALPRQD